MVNENTQTTRTQVLTENHKLIDARGGAFASNYMEIIGGKPFYGGVRVHSITEPEKVFIGVRFQIITAGVEQGAIWLSSADAEKLELLVPVVKKVTYYVFQ